MKRLVADKQAKQAQSSSTQAPKGGQGMKSSSIWRQYGGARGAGIEDGQGPSGQPGSDATKIKHAHEGFVGFNQVIKDYFRITFGSDLSHFETLIKLLNYIR